MAKTVIRKKIEVLVDMPLLSRIEKLAERAEIKFFMVLPTRGGGTEQGRWYDDRVTGGAGTKVLFSAITTDEKASNFIDALEPLLDSYGIIVTRSDVEVIRSEKF
jgi:hypothetical protein